MKKLKNSLMVLAGCTAIVGLISLVTPMSGRGQGNNAPPARDVNVVNTPSVNVANPPTSPVLVRDVDSAREPFQETSEIAVPGGDTSSERIVLEVPVRKRCVIETVSVSVTVHGTDTPSIVKLLTRLTPSSASAHHEISVSKQGVTFTGNPIYVGTHYMRAYAGPQTNIVFELHRSDVSESASGLVTIIGYFLDVP